MRRFLHFGACAVAFFAFAASVSPARADVDDIRKSNNAAWLSIGADYLNYKEPNAQNPVTEKGGITSLAFGAGNIFSDDWYVALDASVSLGGADYDGSSFSQPSTSLDVSTDETVVTINGKLGKGFALGRDVLLTPYVDLGFRFWDRDFSAQPTEHFQTFEILGGAMVQYSPVDRLVLTAYGELGTIFAPQRKVSDVTYDFGEGGAYKAGGRIGYRVTDRVEVFTSLDVSHFRMVKSSSLSGLYAPSGNNTDTSIRAGVSYHLK